GIARAVRDHHRPGGSWSQQAVLVRTNAQAGVIEAALRRGRIPHRVRGRQQFLADPDIRDLLERMRRLREPLATTIEDLTVSLQRQRKELLIAHHGADLSSLRPEAVTLPDTALARRLEGWEQLVRLGHEFLAIEPGARSDLFPSWLTTVLRDDDPGSADAVTISSFHAAKGLEWDIVHLAGLEDGFVPISHARTPEAHAEEIRLLYVAVTRAIRVLRCTYAAHRQFGDREIERQPSPFIDTLRLTITTLRSSTNRIEEPEPFIEQARNALEPGTDR